jgi:hypothetical protein
MIEPPGGGDGGAVRAGAEAEKDYERGNVRERARASTALLLI